MKDPYEDNPGQQNLSKIDSSSSSTHILRERSSGQESDTFHRIFTIN